MHFYSSVNRAYPRGNQPGDFLKTPRAAMMIIITTDDNYSVAYFHFNDTMGALPVRSHGLFPGWQRPRGTGTLMVTHVLMGRQMIRMLLLSLRAFLRPRNRNSEAVRKETS